MKREEQIEQKAKELGQKYFPNENNIWARPNYEAQFVESACKEMIDWADEHPNLDEWFDNIRVWLMNNDKLRRMIGLSNQYELVTELRKFLKNKQDGK